jgi:uncharacterized protein YcgI (DUF1989 family)
MFWRKGRPLSAPTRLIRSTGDYVVFEAEQDLIIGLTACSALQSNNYAFKPIHYSIERPGTEGP